jgi:integrase
MRIYRRKHKLKTTWSVDYRAPDGTHVRRAIGTRKEAEIVLADIRLKMLKGDKVPGLDIAASWAEARDRYFEHAEQVNKPYTFKADKGRLKLLDSYFSAQRIVRLPDITPGVIARFQAEYMKTHSRKTWNNLLTLLKTIINRAVDWGLISHNPITRLKPLKIDRTFHYFTAEEIRLILDNAKYPLSLAVTILLNTGIRRGELWQLHWRDIDLKARKLHIKPSKSFSPKSRDIRSIPLRPAIVSYLAQYRRAPGVCLCCDFRNIHSIRRQFVKLLKSLEIEGTLHDLRHTFASHLAMAGVPIPVIKELLGHGDIQTTMIYAHLSPETHQEAVDRLNF